MRVLLCRGKPGYAWPGLPFCYILVKELNKGCRMSVRAKFAVNLVREDKQEDGTPLYRVNMHAAQDGNKENKAFFAGVPSATLSLYTISENTAKKLVEGKLYYVDFIPAD